MCLRQSIVANGAIGAIGLHDKRTINDPIGLHDQNGHNIQFKNRHSCTLTCGQPSFIHPCNVPEHNQQPTPIHGLRTQHPITPYTYIITTLLN